MDPVGDYIAGFLSLDHPHLAVVAEQEEASDVPPSIGPEVGKLLGLLVRMIRAQRVLELGTALGYSTIWLAEAARATGGRLISVENDANLFEETEKNLAAAGLSGVVDLIFGDAQTVIHSLDGPFDLILQDSAKTLYPVLLERCIQITRPFGLIVADDGLFLPEGRPERLAQPIHRYNQKAFSDDRLYSTLLPIGDGLTLSVKVKG
jgi:predicted O-methyltransferase YrrM